MVFFGVQAATGKQISGYVREDGSNLPIAEVTVQIKEKAVKALTDKKGYYQIKAEEGEVLVFSRSGFNSVEKAVDKSSRMDVLLSRPESVIAREMVMHNTVPMTASVSADAKMYVRTAHRAIYSAPTESYKGINENNFLRVTKTPLSTFAADVDGASYSNVRRYLNLGQMPPPDAVRVEEMINYFTYDLEGPKNANPVHVTTELTQAPWNSNHQLMRIALKAKDIPTKSLPPANFVFLIDVSGSMSSSNKLPLVKSSYKMLVDQLRDEDRVAIVTYAGVANVALESTAGTQKRKIKDVIDGLGASGGTAGGAGLTKAYQIARDHFVKKGNNRIILATDGDFNIGESSDSDMERLISKEREHGISLSILGYGMGNYQDSKLELLANKGHGNYAYIDNISEARKAIVTEFGASLFTVAKDVKIQVEFNPQFVQSYRLVGYEHNLLEAEDFNNDEKLGGDMGVGHVVTALYEIVPGGVESTFSGSVDDLKYQKAENKVGNRNSKELATVKFRYKEPDSKKSKLVSHIVAPNAIALTQVSQDFRFATAVAEFGMLIRNSAYKQQANFDKLIQRAKEAKGRDEEGYRSEFIRLAQDGKALWKVQQ